MAHDDDIEEFSDQDFDQDSDQEEQDNKSVGEDNSDHIENLIEYFKEIKEQYSKQKITDKKYYSLYVDFLIRKKLLEDGLTEDVDQIREISKLFYDEIEFDDDFFIQNESTISKLIDKEIDKVIYKFNISQLKYVDKEDEESDDEDLVKFEQDLKVIKTKENAKAAKKTAQTKVSSKKTSFQKDIIKEANKIFNVLKDTTDKFPDVRNVPIDIEFLILNQVRLEKKDPDTFVQVYTDIFKKKLDSFKDTNMNFEKYVHQIIVEIIADKGPTNSTVISDEFFRKASLLDVPRYLPEDSIKLEHMKLLYCTILAVNENRQIYKKEDVSADFQSKSFSYLIEKYGEFIDLSMEIRADISEDPVNGSWSIDEMFDYFIRNTKSTTIRNTTFYTKGKGCKIGKKKGKESESDETDSDTDIELGIDKTKRSYIDTLYANSINVAKFTDNINTLDKYTVNVNRLIDDLSSKYNISRATLENLTDIHDIHPGDYVTIKSLDQIKLNYEKTFIDKLKTVYKDLGQIIKNKEKPAQEKLDEIINFYKSEVSQSNQTETDLDVIYKDIKYNIDECKSLGYLTGLDSDTYTGKLYNKAGYTDRYARDEPQIQQKSRKTSRKTSKLRKIDRFIRSESESGPEQSRMQTIKKDIQLYKVVSVKNDHVKLTVTGLKKKLVLPISYVQKAHSEHKKTISVLKPILNTHSYNKQIKVLWKFVRDLNVDISDIAKGPKYYKDIYVKACIKWLTLNKLPEPTYINVIETEQIYEYLEKFKDQSHIPVLKKDQISFIFHKHYFIPHRDDDEKAHSMNITEMFKNLDIYGLEYVVPIDNLVNKLYRDLTVNQTIYKDVLVAVAQTKDYHFFILDHDLKKGPDSGSGPGSGPVSGPDLDTGYRGRIVYYQKLPMSSDRANTVTVSDQANDICKVLIQNRSIGDEFELSEFIQNLRIQNTGRLSYDTVKAWSEYIPVPNSSDEIKIVTTDFDEYLNLKLKKHYLNCIASSSSKNAIKYISGYLEHIVEIEGYLGLADILSKEVKVMLDSVVNAESFLKKLDEDELAVLKADGLKEIATVLSNGPDYRIDLEKFQTSLADAIFEKSLSESVKSDLSTTYKTNINQVLVNIGINTKLVLLSIPEIFAYTFNEIKYSKEYYKNLPKINKIMSRDLSSTYVKDILLNYKVSSPYLDALVKIFEKNKAVQETEINNHVKQLENIYKKNGILTGLSLDYTSEELVTDYVHLQKLINSKKLVTTEPKNWSKIKIANIDNVLKDLNNIIMFSVAFESNDLFMMRSAYLKIEFQTKETLINYATRKKTIDLIYQMIKPYYVPSDLKTNFDLLNKEAEISAKNLEEVIINSSKTASDYYNKVNNFKDNYANFKDNFASKETLTKKDDKQYYVSNVNYTIPDLTDSKFVDDLLSKKFVVTLKNPHEKKKKSVVMGPLDWMSEISTMQKNIYLKSSEEILTDFILRPFAEATYKQVPFELVKNGIYVKRCADGMFMYSTEQISIEYSKVEFDMTMLHIYVNRGKIVGIREGARDIWITEEFDKIFKIFNVQNVRELVSLISFYAKDTAYLNIHIFKKIGPVDSLPTTRMCKLYNGYKDKDEEEKEPEYRSVSYEKLENYPVPIEFRQGLPVFSEQQEVMIKYHLDACTMSPWLSSRYSMLTKDELPYIIVNSSTLTDSGSVIKHDPKYPFAHQYAETSKYYVTLFFSDPHYNKLYTMKVGTNRSKYYNIVTIPSDYNVFEESRITKIINDQGLGRRIVSLEKEQDHMMISLYDKNIKTTVQKEIGLAVKPSISETSNYSLVNTLDLTGDVKGRYKEDGKELNVWDWAPQSKYTADTKTYLDSLTSAKNILKNLARTYGSDKPVYHQKFNELEKHLQKVRFNLPSEVYMRSERIKVKSTDSIWSFDAPKDFAEDWANIVSNFKQELKIISEKHEPSSQEFITAKYNIEKNMLYKKNWYLSFYDFVQEKSSAFQKDLDSIKNDKLSNKLLQVDLEMYTDLFIQYKVLVITDEVLAIMKKPKSFVKNYYRMKHSDEDITIFGSEDNKKFTEKINQETASVVTEISVLELFKNMNETVVMSPIKNLELNKIIKARKYKDSTSLYTFLRALLEYKYGVVVKEGSFIKSSYKPAGPTAEDRKRRRHTTNITCTNMTVYVKPIDVINYMGDSYGQNDVYKRAYINEFTWKMDETNTKTRTMVDVHKYLTVVNGRFEFVLSERNQNVIDAVPSSYLRNGRTQITLVDENLHDKMSVTDNAARRLALVCDIDLNDIVPMLNSTVYHGANSIVKEDIHKFIRVGSVRDVTDTGNMLKKYRDYLKSIMFEMSRTGPEFNEKFIMKKLNEQNLGISSTKYIADLRKLFTIESKQALAAEYRSIVLGQEDVILNNKHDPETYIASKEVLVKNIFPDFKMSDFVSGTKRIIEIGQNTDVADCIQKKYKEFKDPALALVSVEDLKNIFQKTDKQIAKIYKRHSTRKVRKSVKKVQI